MALIEPVELVGADQLGPVHFIAIGGSGMSGIAALYAQRGIPVSGSDQQDSATLRALVGLGVRAVVGHDPANLGDATTVVLSSAVRQDNVELVAARARGLRIWHRSAALAALMLGARGIAVTGTHGKTTTSAMTAVMLAGVGRDPSYVIGSPLAGTSSSSHDGTGQDFVIEADESDGSFLQYPAEIVVVTTVEADHLDNWGTASAYAQGFDSLVRGDTVRTVVLDADDPGTAAVAEAARAAGRRVISVGEGPSADVRILDPGAGATGAIARLSGLGWEGELRLAVPGLHNLHNAAAAWAVGRLLGHDGGDLARSLAGFKGTSRRFESVAEVAGVWIVDDYAHHPTELIATLAAARQVASGRRLVACFQPHLFTRTRDLAVEFGAALTAADVVVVLDVYPAREDPLPGVTGQLVADAVAATAPGLPVAYVADLAAAPAILAGLVEQGDLVLTLGAGSVTTVGPALAGLLEAG